MTAMDQVLMRASDPKETATTAKREKREKSKSRRAPRPPKPHHRPHGSVVAALDIGTTKVCCFIARVEPEKPQVIGIGHQISRGLRNGTIVDLEAAGASIVNAVHAAEEMAKETIEQVVTNLSGGFSASRIIKGETTGC